MQIQMLLYVIPELLKNIITISMGDLEGKIKVRKFLQALFENPGLTNHG
jgi:hypothetical protein